MEPREIVDLKFGLTCGWNKGERWDCFHRHDEIEITFFTRGEPTIYRFGGKLIEIRSTQSILFWGSIPHQQVEVDPSSVQYWLTIPPEVFLRWEISEDLRRDIFDGKMLAEEDQQLRELDLLSFPIWKQESQSQDRELQKTMAMAVETRLRRFAASLAQSQDGRKSAQKYLTPKDKNSFMIMYDFITTHYKEQIHIEDIAAAAGLNPNYAITLFKEKCGINITDLLTMLRVYESQRLLFTTDLKIIDIAMEAGFGSVSNFYKCFNRLCRRNPKDYKALRNHD